MAEETRPRRGFQLRRQDLKTPEVQSVHEDFGDLEYVADLMPYLDPVARFGVDPTRARIVPDQDSYEYSLMPTQNLDRMSISLSDGIMSKNTQAHEWRHRGFVKLYEEYLKNREFYDKKYGADMGAMLRGIVDGPPTKNQSWSERKGDISEMAAEFFEKPEDFNMPAGYKFSDGTTTGGYNSGVKPITAAYEKENPQLTKEKTVAAPNTSGYLSDLETYKQKEFREYLKQPEDERESLFFDAMLKTQDFAKDLSSARLGGEGTPSKFAQGGPVMRGIGTLNETARNMTRGPRGIGAYQQFASGGEAMGPPPTRGPDPQGIGYFQQFADGGPVYMQEGGDPFAEVDFDKLTAAVIQTESAGDPNAVSEDDAIGLMQVLPSTGAQPGYEQLGAQNVFDIAIDLGFPIDDSERTVEKARELLFEPEINVTFGTKYLRAMIAHSGGDIKRALQKYNTGTGNYQAFVEGRKPLDQEAVRYPVLVANALTGGNLAMPEASPFTPTPVQRGEDLIMSMPVAQSDAMSPLAIENRREGTEFQGQDAYSAGENLSRQTRQDFGSQAQQDDFEAMTPQNISMRERYSSPNMAAELVGGEEALKEGIGGLTRSLRPELRPPSVEFKGGVSRSLMPRYRPELEKEYPGNDTDALMRGLRGIRGRTLRKGFTPYVQDVRGELT